MSAVAHHISGVLDHDSMARIVQELCESYDFRPGDRVMTMKGSVHGTIAEVLPDGRVVVRADSGVELTALPESLVRERDR